MLRVCFALVCAFGWGCTAAPSHISKNDVPECKGVFDFYFVLDSSGSVSGYFHTEIVPFVGNVTINFVNPNFQVAFITFASTAVMHLNLTRTADRSSIQAGLTRLKQFNPTGSTHLAPGLQLVNHQISSLGGDRASVILILTDGHLGDLTQSQLQADLARQKGARIFAIGVGDVSREQLLTIVDDEDQLYIGGNFRYLDKIINSIINETCTEITSVDPYEICLGSTLAITVTGRGFTNYLNQDKVACRFRIGEDKFIMTHPSSEQVQYDTIICPAPDLNHTGVLLLQVTLNGISFISSNVTMEVSDCLPEDFGFVAGIVCGLLALLALLALCLLWFFCPLITGKIVGGLPPEPKEPQPKAKPPKKWAVVDAHYYGRGGPGGMTPVTVHWGKDGATETGNKLIKAKNANVVGMKYESGTSALQQATPGCCDRIKRKIRRWYAVASSYRPVRGPTKHIVWFPGPKLGKQRIQATNRTAIDDSDRSAPPPRSFQPPRNVPPPRNTQPPHRSAPSVSLARNARSPQQPPLPRRPPPPRH